MTIVNTRTHTSAIEWVLALLVCASCVEAIDPGWRERGSIETCAPCSEPYTGSIVNNKGQIKHTCVPLTNGVYGGQLHIHTVTAKTSVRTCRALAVKRSREPEPEPEPEQVVARVAVAVCVCFGWYVCGWCIRGGSGVEVVSTRVHGTRAQTEPFRMGRITTNYAETVRRE